MMDIFDEKLKERGYELKERISLIVKVGDIHSIKNHVSTTLKNYEDMVERGTLESFAVITNGNNEYNIYVRNTKKKD